MRIGIFNDEDQIASLAADRILEVYRAKPNFVLGLVTGSSSLKFYVELMRRYEVSQTSFAQVRFYDLNEYVGLPRDHYEDYASFIHRNLVDLVDTPEDAVHGPDGWCNDLEAGTAVYDEAVKADGGISIQALGIGPDGHIGFNEPGGTLASRTYVGVLTEQTHRDNAHFFDGDIDQVPTHCVTQGPGTIMNSRIYIFTATGEGKIDAAKAMIEDGVTQRRPTSALQHHPNVTVLLDGAVASKFKLASFYGEVQEKEHL